MPFPDLQLTQDLNKGPGGTNELFAEGEGVPDNGDNTFRIPFLDAGILPENIDEDQMKIFVIPDRVTTGVTDASFVSLSGDKQFMTINFVQSGAGVARVVVEITHSATR